MMLLPDDTYRQARPKTDDHHLTIAHFGKAADITTDGIARLRAAVQMLGRFTGGPISAKANGIGVFNAGQDGFAVVDLIDGIGTFNVRSRIENLFGRPAGLDGVTINYQHGFTPHMTREYLTHEDGFYAEVSPDMIDNIEFKFIAVGLWHNDQRYEVAL